MSLSTIFQLYPGSFIGEGWEGDRSIKPFKAKGILIPPQLIIRPLDATHKQTIKNFHRFLTTYYQRPHICTEIITT